MRQFGITFFTSLTRTDNNGALALLGLYASFGRKSEATKAVAAQLASVDGSLSKRALAALKREKRKKAHGGEGVVVPMADCGPSAKRQRTATVMTDTKPAGVGADGVMVQLVEEAGWQASDQWPFEPLCAELR